MKKTIWLCTFSAILGAAISWAMTGPQAPLTEPNSAAAAAIEGFTPIPKPATATPINALGPGDDLTPEERVNVAVYENANRSVVHIATRGYRGDTFSPSDVALFGGRERRGDRLRKGIL